MTTVLTIRHRAALCGYVRDASSGGPIAGAQVELVGRDAQARTRADGFYSFMDLPDGTYTLRASAPARGSRYGSVLVAGVTVASDATGRPRLDSKGNIDLPATRISGRVSRSDNAAAVALAEVKLSAAGVSIRTDKQGQYSLAGVQAGAQTLRVAVAGFSIKSQQVTLNPGLELQCDVSLTPLS